MKISNCAIALILIIMASCQADNKSVTTYTLSRSDFSELIYGIGTLQSANNNVIVTPRIPSSSIKITHLGKEGTQVKAGDTVCILEANDIKSQYDLQVEGLQKLEADLVKLEAANAVALALLQATLEEFKAEKRLSKLDSLQMKFSSENKSQIKKLEERINEIQQQKTIRKMEAQNIINKQSARALQSQIIQKKQVITRFQDLLDQLTLKATAPGMLLHARSPMRTIISSDGEISSSGGDKITVGSSVGISMPLVQLPDLDSMQVVIMLQEAEYKRVQKGQKVVIKSEAQPDLVTCGTVKSKTLSSSPLAYNYKVKSYKIVIDIDSLDNHFLPGLSANCELIVKEVNDTIVAPGIAIFETDSTKFLYVKRDKYFEKQIIETGSSNQSETIISKGLVGNETIALLEPPKSQIRKTQRTKNE